MSNVHLSVGLLELEPDLGRFLDPEERDLLRALRLPLASLEAKDADLAGALRRGGAFSAIVTSGLLGERLLLGGQTGLRLLGPGDIVTAPQEPRSMLLGRAEIRALAPTRLALMGREVQLAVRRFPALLPALHLRFAAQTDRLAAQLMICQLPRVEERLMALMWLLAESWGHVTPAGTSLPLELRHETLGCMIGARRPTVTLALGELAERGALVRQDGRWLLLEGPPDSGARGAKLDPPGLTLGSRWDQPFEAAAPVDDFAELRERLQAMTLDVAGRRHLIDEQLERLETSRLARARSETLKTEIRHRRTPDAPAAPAA